MNKAGTPGFFGGIRSSALSSTSEEFEKEVKSTRTSDCDGVVRRSSMFSSALTVACNRNSTSSEFDDEVKSTSTSDSGEASLDRFYKIQSLQLLGDEDDQVVVPIWIAREPNRQKHMNVASAWIDHLQQAINDINFAAPGLFLYITSNPLEAKIKIAGNNQGTGCFTRGNILQTTNTEIVLYSDWSEMKSTSCHELLHALGFDHEHQRRDRDSSLHLNWQRSPGDDWYKQYEIIEEILGLTRFDPFSIMLYPEDEELSRNRGDPIWYTKPQRELNREMSELDKVALNNVYRPCKGPRYSPKKSGETGLWYCGREFGEQSPGQYLYGRWWKHDGHCGPTNGPSCPACRVLKSDRVEKLWRKGKWQGWTGSVYCGRHFCAPSDEHNGYCGPNNGPSCPECYDEDLHS